LPYGTNNEFGFDYLRDNRRGHLHCGGGHYYAIVDEADSIPDHGENAAIISGERRINGQVLSSIRSFLNCVEISITRSMRRHRDTHGGRHRAI
jgi:preprotein translocase subunit SecA